jgi:hypothetical protein
VRTSKLQKGLPQAADIFWQVQVWQGSRNFFQVKLTDIFHPSMREHLLQVPASLKGIG